MTTLTSGDTAIYDAWNRLMQVDNGSAVVEKYAYDGTNRRIQISSDFTGSTPGTVVDEYLSGQQVIESDVTTGGDRAGGYQYVWSPRYIDAPVVRDTLTTDGAGIVATSRLFYLGDANYNVTALIGYDSGSSSWAVTERYSYTPYGVATVYDVNWANPGTTSSVGNTILFAGRELDITGLYYNRARNYDPVAERFINRDPIASTTNLYCYCGDEPVAQRDPTGRACSAALYAAKAWGTKYVHTCIQIERDEIRYVNGVYWTQEWTQTVPPSCSCDQYGQQWQYPGQLQFGWVPHYYQTQVMVHATYAIELTEGPFVTGGRPAGTIATGPAPLGNLLPPVQEAWALVIRPGKCGGTGTPIPGRNQCALVQSIINSAYAVAAASNGQPYYLFNSAGQWMGNNANTCNSAVWQILTGAGITTGPWPGNLAPGWGHNFSR